MKLSIDTLSDDSGWVINAPSTIQEIEEKSFIAGLNSKSLMIKFDSSDTVKTATKTLGTPIDVTDYDSLIFSIWSQTKGENKAYIKPADFVYKIDIDGVREFYIPCYETFSDIVIGIEDVTSITQIKITALHEDTDYIIISEMVAEKEEIPIDILNAVKEHIDYYLTESQGDGILLGTVTAVVDDTSLTLSNPIHLERYGVIKIDDDENSEIHQIDDNNAGTFKINNNFDGGTILNNFTAANVYLQFPAFINPGQDEIRLPGISIWGISPEPILRGNKLDTLRDSFLVSGDSKERCEGQILKYSVLIDCEARNHKLIDIMARVVRRFIAKETLWINGRKHEIYFSGPALEVKPISGIDFIPKVQYSLDVEVKENINDRQAVPVTTTINTIINIS